MFQKKKKVEMNKLDIMFQKNIYPPFLFKRKAFFKRKKNHSYIMPIKERVSVITHDLLNHNNHSIIYYP